MFHREATFIAQLLKRLTLPMPAFWQGVQWRAAALAAAAMGAHQLPITPEAYKPWLTNLFFLGTGIGLCAKLACKQPPAHPGDDPSTPTP